MSDLSSPNPPRSRRTVAVLGLSAVAAVAVGGTAYFKKNPLPTEAEAAAAETLKGVIESEELILRYTPRLKQLSKSVSNMALQDFRSADLFAPQVEVYGLAADVDLPAARADQIAPVHFNWPIEEQPVSGGSMEEQSPWKPLFDRVSHFEHAKIYFIRGEFIDDELKEWKALSGFSALARGKDGGWISVSGKQELYWREDRSAEPDEEGRYPWRIYKWKQKKLHVARAQKHMFEDVSKSALVDAETRELVQTSLLDELIISMANDPKWEEPYWGWHFIAWDHHPGLSVVDIDHDGFDDIFIARHFGDARLLRNRGDETFVDVTEQYGLGGHEYVTSSLFADFDNDGDHDLFLGRTAERTEYLEQVDGKFVAASDKVAVDLPYLTTSLSAADYDGDGLLDVHLSTYAVKMIRMQKAGQIPTDPEGTLLSPYLPAEDAKELHQRSLVAHEFLDQVGPPNLLLHNVGGRFEVAAAQDSLSPWRSTYHGGWSDYDGDGDQDLYVAHDFAPNNLFRNDGDGKFTDVTGPTGTEDVGFGMGVSWGDYDNDGAHDLYVTNMYSKAGRRITGGLGKLIDGNFSKMAAGNSLFHNDGETFSHVSGLKAPKLMVEKGGWGWGSQFADFDNDTFLDIYALSGFYTAPKPIAVDVDL